MKITVPFLCSFCIVYTMAQSNFLDRPFFEDEKIAVQDVINKWNYPGPLGRREGTIFEVKGFGFKQAKLDLQKVYEAHGNTFERFAVNSGGQQYFSTVHIQRGVNFGSALIRAAFEESRDRKAHVFLTSPGARINEPRDARVYRERTIDMWQNGQRHSISIWGVSEALENLTKNFNGRCQC